MLRLRAFRPTSDTIVKIELHSTHQWMATADASDRVSVWDREHCQMGISPNERQDRQDPAPSGASWMVTVDASDRLSVWDWKHRQLIYKLKVGGVDERQLVGPKSDKLAQGKTGNKTGAAAEQR